MKSNPSLKLNSVPRNSSSDLICILTTGPPRALHCMQIVHVSSQIYHSSNTSAILPTRHTSFLHTVEIRGKVFTSSSSSRHVSPWIRWMWWCKISRMRTYEESVESSYFIHYIYSGGFAGLGLTVHMTVHVAGIWAGILGSLIVLWLVLGLVLSKLFFLDWFLVSSIHMGYIISSLRIIYYKT